MTLTDLLNLARAKGTDAEYRAWIQRQPSCISNEFSEWLEDLGEWRNPACHVRRGGNSGTAYKEPYACVPMTNEEHRIQSVNGEAACLERFLGGNWTVQDAKTFFDELRVRYLIMWLES